MNLMETAQLLGNFGEFVGAIAVVFTLAYLAFQIRQNSKTLQQNTRATEAGIRQAFATQDQAFLSNALDSAVLAQAVSKGDAILRSDKNEEALSPIERSQLIGRQHVNFRIFEHAYFQLGRGFLDREEWERYQRIIRFLMQDDDHAQAMWSRLSELFNQEFVAEVERVSGAA